MITFCHFCRMIMRKSRFSTIITSQSHIYLNSCLFVDQTVVFLLLNISMDDLKRLFKQCVLSYVKMLCMSCNRCLQARKAALKEM